MPNLWMQRSQSLFALVFPEKERSGWEGQITGSKKKDHYNFTCMALKECRSKLFQISELNDYRFFTFNVSRPYVFKNFEILCIGIAYFYCIIATVAEYTGLEACSRNP